jgi:energy-coupling factor transport system substrate-specific component
VNPIGWILGAEGTTLVAVICALMFLEEIGVPLFFAPGDIVLAAAGVAVAGGRVNPAALVGAVFVTCLVGAMLGREIFARIGWDRLMRLAGPLRIRKPLERASILLQRGGWRAVFTARLIPGLRVHTTEVAGVSRLSRRAFLEGLVPSLVVYIGAFVGLGAAFGKPILALIHAAEHQALVAILLVVAAIVIFLLTRAPARETFAALQAAGWSGPLNLRLDSVSVVLVLACIGLDFAGHALTLAFNLPLFLDSIGTVLAGVTAGPWIGGSVGFVSNLVTSNTVDPIAAPYAIVSFGVGFAAGLARYLNWQRRLGGWVALWLVCFAIAALVSTPINLLMSGGKSGVAFGDSIYAALAGAKMPGIVAIVTGTRLPGFLAALIGEAAIDFPDKLITVVTALLIAQGLPEPRSLQTGARLDLVDAATFVLRSHRWVRRTAVAALCLLFFWLVVPLFLLLGYVIAIARNVRDGVVGLPPWDRRWFKIKDGFKVLAALLIWLIPTLLLSIPAGVVGSAQQQASPALGLAFSQVASVLAAIGSLWSVVILLIEPAILSQYLEGGFRGALRVPSVVRRIQVNLSLSIVVGVLVVVLTTIGLIGTGALVIGLLFTLPYASFVGAYLVGQYARLTDQRVSPSRVELRRERADA